MKNFLLAISMTCAVFDALAQEMDHFPVKEHFTKQEVYIRMRDGVRLFTSIYTPRDTTQAWPILMERTPYSVAPYGPDMYAASLGPNPSLMREGYIFVYQDVRGRYKSEGTFREMTPHSPSKKDSSETDESSDTWDTIEWLSTHVKPYNGRVGLYGISYPGFYATASLPGAHPAIRAVSPQAPVTDEFIGDDANHKGAFYLLDNFDFMNYFDAHRDGPVEEYSGSVIDLDIKDAYAFFLKLGPLSNSNSPKYFNHRAQTWNEYLQHDTYDEYWRSRNIRNHLHDIRPATLVVGGWFDAEDLFGALETYRTIEQKNPGGNNQLVMGPWTHGAWANDRWTKFASHDLKQDVNPYYRDSLETPFFNFWLKDKGEAPSAEATIFETGSNRWMRQGQWPPAGTKPTSLYLTEKGSLQNAAAGKGQFRSYTSDPANPVPYTGVVKGERNNEYMAEDQRFLNGRKDVLTFQTGPLAEDLHVAGPIMADIFLSTTGTDVDIVVKLIDVFPDTASDASIDPGNFKMAGMQRLVRAEPFRGKFRKSFEKPEPFVPGKVEEIKYELPDVAHLFKKGHRVMVQVQSSWFPLVDRNPQTFVRIPDAKPEDFRKAEIRIYTGGKSASRLILPVQ
jgi:putative CocE/NonD family hydrolase